MPTLVIHGDHEMPLLQMVADTLVRRIPNARKVVVIGGGHGAHMYEPAQFNNALMAFFREVDGKR
jgi:pimeloyl-ACP methyl ester carboxylesterase